MREKWDNIFEQMLKSDAWRIVSTAAVYYESVQAGREEILCQEKKRRYQTGYMIRWTL